MSKALDKTIEEGKVWGLRLVLILTVFGTVYTSIFKTEDEARDYYSLLQPVVSEAYQSSQTAQRSAFENALEIAELRAALRNINQCAVTRDSEVNIPTSSKESRDPHTEEAPVSDNELVRVKKSSKPNENNSKYLLPEKPWKQQTPIIQP